MKVLIFVLLNVLVLNSPQYSQTQLLKVGNAIQYSDEGNYEWTIVTTKTVTINGKEYFERKSYSPWFIQSVFIKSYERIEGDSACYVLNASNLDSLIFNFNWSRGKNFFTGADGNILSGQRIDSIKIVTTFLNDDTVYVLKNFTYNTTTGDTNFNVIPVYNYLSKKIGRLDGGMWVYATGAKVNGTRYGEVYPYPEEITFSTDSLYKDINLDTTNCYIRNNSDYNVVLDSIISLGGWYGYRGWFTSLNTEIPFYLFQSYPSSWWGDTLNLQIDLKDSIKISINDVDLCPVCKKQPNEYFQDTLRFVFTYKGGKEYSFSKAIPISGEGHPSDVKNEKSFPNDFALYQNYPNPFNPSTTISWQSPVSSWQTLKIFDVLGNEVATLVNEYRDAGTYENEFNAEKLSSGVYFYQLKAGDFVETKKMTLLR